MQIHELKSIKKRVQRIGRSGKRGSYSGRGVKGQKSRSGRRLRPAERDLILRIPKRRGFANLAKSDKPIVLNLHDLAATLKSLVKAGQSFELNLESLREHGFVRKGYRGEVKLLGTGELTIPFKVTGLKTSSSAKAKIKAAGGSVA